MIVNPFKRLVTAVGLLLVACAPALAVRELVDELGRRVVVPDDAHRIICLAPSLTETVYALGLGEAVAGVTDYTDYTPEARAKPSVGGLTDASMEKIVALHPDLVLALHDLNRRETVDELEHLGIPVFVADPHGLQGILASIEHIGQALDRGAGAENLVKRLEERRAS